VLPALIRKAWMLKSGEAKTLPVWGSGEARREFLHVDDCADACLFLMRNYTGEEHVNVGTGEDIRIIDLARLVCRIVGTEPRIELDPAKPDGTPRKLMDIGKLRALGWSPSIALEEGISRTWAELRDQNRFG
ncbi:MAG: GDP-L-fucose synthase, partial [Sphingomonadales bacterium]|nr:GDP-L-fucose synthase [Sphingomonadales bacterium]